MDNIGVVNYSEFVEFKNRMKAQGRWNRNVEIILDKYWEDSPRDYVTDLDDILLTLNTMTTDKPEETPAPDSWEEFTQVLEDEFQKEMEKQPAPNTDTPTES